MVSCNKCNKHFKIKVRTKRIDKDVKEVFFNCPHCYERYTAYFVNKDIKEKQREIREKYKQLRVSKDKERIKKEIKQMKILLKIDMENLQNKMLSTR